VSSLSQVRSTPPSQGDLIKPVSMSVRPQIDFYLNIWYDEWYTTVCHDQIQGHRGPKVVKIADFKVCLLHQYACNQKTNSELWYSRTILTDVWYSSSFGVTWPSKLWCSSFSKLILSLARSPVRGSFMYTVFVVLSLARSPVRGLFMYTVFVADWQRCRRVKVLNLVV